MKRRKILILSHNPINDEDNMGKTMSNIFGCFEKEELCQIYIRNQKPNFYYCKDYYYIDEILMLKSILCKKINTGFFVEDKSNKKHNKNNVDKSSKLKQTIYNIGRRRNQLIYLLRNLLWKKGKWCSDDLKKWLKLQQPACIFLMAGDYSFLFDMAIYLSKMLEIPLFTYYVDEFYFTKRKQQILSIEGRLYQKHFKNVYMNSKMNFCISESMCEVYSKEFEKNSALLMNSLNINNIKNNNSINDIYNKKTLKMFYIGNISYDRWKSLSALSTGIMKLNNIYDRKIEFFIYSSEKNQKLLKKLTSNQNVNFGGSLSLKEVEDKITESDILVHVESFDKRNIEKVKYSISTKIPDLLNSGKFILTFGPNNVEAINYLKRNNAAFSIIDENELLDDLKLIYENKVEYNEFIRNAQKLLLENHQNNKIKKFLESYL